MSDAVIDEGLFLWYYEVNAFTSPDEGPSYFYLWRKIMELMFAERLRKYRRDRDLTQEELAQAIGISPQSISKWERGFSHS